MNVNAVNHVKFLKIDVMGSVNFVKIGFVQSSKHQEGRANVFEDRWDDEGESEQQV